MEVDRVDARVHVCWISIVQVLVVRNIIIPCHIYLGKIPLHIEGNETPVNYQDVGNHFSNDGGASNSEVVCDGAGCFQLSVPLNVVVSLR